MKNPYKVLLAIAIGFILYHLIPLFTALLAMAAIVLFAYWCIGLYHKNFKEDKSNRQWS